MSTSGAAFVERCGDIFYNYSGGKYSINLIIKVARYFAPEGATTLGNYFTDTAASDLACAIETKTGYSPITCLFTTAAIVCGGIAARQYAYNRYKVKTPRDLMETILTKYADILLSDNLKNLTKIFESVVDAKAESVLKDIQNSFPDVFAKWSDSFKNEVKAAAKDKEMKALPARLEQNKDTIKDAVLQSKAEAAPQIRSLGMLESAAKPVPLDLKNALFDILFNANKPVASQVMAAKLK